MAVSNAPCPGLELFPGPLEAVVLVPKPPALEPREVNVVLRIRRREHDGSGSRELKNNALEGVQARRIQVFDDLDDSGGVKACDTAVAVKEAAVEERYPCTLPRRHRRKVEAIRRTFERAMRHVEADDALEGGLLQQSAKEPALAAAQVHDRFAPEARRAATTAPCRCSSSRIS